MKHIHPFLRLLLTGFCMGAADVVPGVSGGTMAFILGIYKELIDAIHAFGQKAFWVDFFRGRWKRAFEDVDGPFLIAVGVGIALAILSLAHTLEFLLEEHPLQVWSFFFGLVVASVHVVARRIRYWSGACITAAIVGAVSSFLIVGLVPVETPDAPWFLILSGAIAICAMILPGISGAFLLVLLGKYEYVLSAVSQRDFGAIVYVGIGAVIGIIAFSQVLSWLLHHKHDLTVAFLTGLMIGSLRKIWPWKGPDGLLETHNVLPALMVDGSLNPALTSGIGLMVAGFVTVLLLEWLARRKNVQQALEA